MHSALRPNSDTVPNGNVPRDTNLPANLHPVANARTPRDADLSRQHATLADPDVVSDLA